ncbi:hypothetical protein ACVDG8_034575 [Mesorhizobium sp. ORM8.1]
MLEYCPTIAEMHTITIDKPSEHGKAYDSDLIAFRNTRFGKRNNLIRLVGKDEFQADWYDDFKWLLVWVIQRKPGTHIILPLFRGHVPFKFKAVDGFQYADVTTDDEVFELIDHLTRNRNEDTVDWKHYRAASWS